MNPFPRLQYDYNDELYQNNLCPQGKIPKTSFFRAFSGDYPQKTLPPIPRCRVYLKVANAIITKRYNDPAVPDNRVRTSQ